ncbi:hypothetical protein N8I77_006456 [Diaporthe amygdali]|uniref:Myb-like domain-containing protein n=1 Tax=Phomopsis amygdali TaxID=1214568 RepID=A0AAD9W409_PHOAM|nr:hypothetical protein N8I77_006456 [Diaporthe amygdali]
MSTNKKWDDASQKDLIFAILMSTGDGSGNIKANWPEVERIMTSWGYGFTAGAMSQQWSKKIQKEFKARHPDTANGGGGSNSNSNPATPSKATGSSRPPKTPASTKGKIKGRKRLAADDDEDTSPEGGAFNPTPIAKEKTPRAGVKKMKYSEPEEGEDDEEEDVVVKGETKDDEDYSHAV